MYNQVLGNQREGYTAVDGEVVYGGTDAATMKKNFRSEVLYGPEVQFVRRFRLSNAHIL